MGRPTGSPVGVLAVFPWKWLGSTKGFETTLLHPVEAKNYDFRKKKIMPTNA
jgi:hypothetical protein